VDKDWYFTNEELFNGAETALDAVRANPSFVFGLMLSNIKPAITTLSKFTEIRYLPFLRTWDVLFLVVILVALWATARDADLGIFIAASLVMLAVSASAMPGNRRHFVAVVPLLVLSAAWYGNLFKGLLSLESPSIRNKLLWAGIVGIGLSLLYYALRATFAPQPGLRTLYSVLVGIVASLPLLTIGLHRSALISNRLRQQLWAGAFVVFIPVVLFSSGVSKWTGLLGDVIEDYRQGGVQILEIRNSTSLKASFDELQALVSRCNGVMALEHTFVAAFMDVPSEGVYDIWEIPPFGRLGESEYDGLRPDRIDCVFLSNRLTTAVGAATNIQLRYDGYIEPYVKQLKELGAEVHDLDRFGQVIVLKNRG
jgi:hypothetical protein